MDNYTLIEQIRDFMHFRLKRKQPCLINGSNRQLVEQALKISHFPDALILVNADGQNMEVRG